jgi:L-threonylcarbamoyladenylate synthase
MSAATPATAAAIREAAAILKRGGLVAFPTETVYGLGADAANVTAVRRCFAAKGRPEEHPLIVHIADAQHLATWAADIPATAWRLTEAFWPGPLTLILKRTPGVNDAVTGGQDTIGVRVPAHPVALELLREFGGGIAAPSANRFGRVSPTTAAHVAAELGTAVDMILDGGPCAVGIESTIVDVTAARPRVLRPGQLGLAALQAVLGTDLATDLTDAPRVSGALASHYAPSTPLRWCERAQLHAPTAPIAARIGVLALHADDAGGFAAWRTLGTDPLAYGHDLYAQLRELDALGLELILVETPPDEAAWEAVRDRLRRALTP